MKEDEKKKKIKNDSEGEEGRGGRTEDDKGETGGIKRKRGRKKIKMKRTNRRR